MKRMPTIVRRLLWVATLSGAVQVQAAALFSQLPVSGLDSLNATFNTADDSGSQLADGFLVNNATITGFAWWGTDVDLGTTSFVVRQFSQLEDGVSKQDKFETQTGTIRKTEGQGLKDSGGLDIFRFELTLDDPVRATGAPVYLSVFLESSDPDGWYWLLSDPGEESAFRGQEGVPWDFGDGNLAFEVVGERDGGQVPEPNVALLLAVAALAAGSARLTQRSALPR